MCVCALGSRDNSVSIWLTGFLRPVVVMEDLFSGPVLDLSWSAIGHNLLACSFDGTVALLKFTEGEIGRTLTKQQKVRLYILFNDNNIRIKFQFFFFDLYLL